MTLTLPATPTSGEEVKLKPKSEKREPGIAGAVAVVHDSRAYFSDSANTLHR